MSDLEKLMEQDAAQPAPVSSDALCALVNLCIEAAKRETGVKEAEDRLEKAKEELKALVEGRIPELMTELRLEHIRLESGEQIALERKVFASLPKDTAKRAAALAYLRSTDAEALISNEIEVKFGKGDNAAVAGLVELLRKRGDAFTQKEGVHPQTLAAWVRESMANGQDVKLDVIGAYILNRASIKR